MNGDPVVGGLRETLERLQADYEALADRYDSLGMLVDDILEERMDPLDWAVAAQQRRDAWAEWNRRRHGL